VLIALARMHTSEMFISARVPARPRQILDGLRYVRGRKDLLLVLFVPGTRLDSATRDDLS
jgi:hypothetical protein